MKNLNHTDPPGLKKWLRLFYLICALLLLADFVPVFHHANDKGPSWWGFYGIYGFTACVLLVVTAKLLRKLVMRSEDYYDEP